MTTITGADGKTTESTIEFVASDRVHAITAGQEIVAVSGATCMRSEGGHWRKLPVDMSGAPLTFHDPAKMEELKKTVKVEQVKFLRADVLNGKPMWVFQYIAKADFGGVQSDATAARAKVCCGWKRRASTATTRLSPRDPVALASRVSWLTPFANPFYLG